MADPCKRYRRDLAVALYKLEGAHGILAIAEDAGEFGTPGGVDYAKLQVKEAEDQLERAWRNLQRCLGKPISSTR